MTYADHPLLSGFRDQPDSVLIDATIAQMDYAVWVQPGHVGMAQEVQDLTRETLKTLPRHGIEKFLYHAIVAAVEADRAVRNRGKDNRVSPTQG